MEIKLYHGAFENFNFIDVLRNIFIIVKLHLYFFLKEGEKFLNYKLV